MGRKLDPENLSDEDIAWLQDRPWKWAEMGLEPIVPESEDDDQPEGGEGESGLDYNDLSKTELATLAHSRGLAKSGSKADLIERLTEQDNEVVDDGDGEEGEEGEGDGEGGEA
jgi:hypothetical protein